MIDADWKLWNLAPLNMNSTLKWHDMDTLYDNLPHKNIILCTYEKQNNIKDRYPFNKF